MRINIDRLSRLAGLPTSGDKKNLYENAHYNEADHQKDEGEYHNEGENHDEGEYHNEDALPFDTETLEEDEGVVGDDDQILEVDEAMLVQELRRMKGIMQESKRRKAQSASKQRRRKQALIEAQLRKVIDEEVQNVLNDIQYGSGWMYGDDKPTRSKNGYSHQGSFLKGFGFK